jgi:hypothetical protein
MIAIARLDTHIDHGTNRSTCASDVVLVGPNGVAECVLGACDANKLENCAVIVGWMLIVFVLELRVIESPRIKVLPAEFVPSISLVRTLPEPTINGDVCANVWPLKTT